MKLSLQKGLKVPNPYIASKGTADISTEGLAPETTDSVMHTQAVDDTDTVGEDTNAPASPYNSVDGLPMAQNEAPSEYIQRAGKSISTKKGG